MRCRTEAILIIMSGVHGSGFAVQVSLP